MRTLLAVVVFLAVMPAVGAEWVTIPVRAEWVTIHEPLSKPTDPLRLLMISDGGKACQAQLAAVYAVRKQCDVVVADIRKGDNRAKLGGLPTAFPYWIMYRGHEALEESSGTLTAGNIAWWFGRVKRGEPLTENQRRFFWASRTQDRLTNLDRVEMRQRLSEASCGMAWCYSHRYLVLDYVTVPDAPGASRAQKPTEGKSCPSGGCPSGGCPSGILRGRFQ